MKIGILTFWWASDNYGQLLQCYALQKYLKDLGHDAFLIKYNPEKDNSQTSTPLFFRVLKAFNPALLFRFIKFKYFLAMSRIENKRHSRHFDAFLNKYIKSENKVYESYKELRENPPSADFYIVGSDQVWNFSMHKNLSHCKDSLHAYFLDFGKERTRRASYAASWSCIDLASEIKSEIRPLLARFEYVSVREKSGVELCRKCGYENSEFVQDPTLLLKAEDYRKIYRESNVQKRERPYLFLYMLSNPCSFDIKAAYRFAREKNLDVVYVTGNARTDRDRKTYAEIPQWLYLVDNAEYVVTNSFHACVFSLIFKRKFGAVPLNKTAKEMNVRLETLFELLNVEPRFISDNDFSAMEKEYEAKPLEEPKRFIDLFKGTAGL